MLASKRMGSLRFVPSTRVGPCVIGRFTPTGRLALARPREHERGPRQKEEEAS